MRAFRLTSALLTILLMATPGLQGQERGFCSDPEYRHFDFWVGEWTVMDPSGTKIGESQVEATMNGCVITEHWTSTRGPEARSLSTFDAPNRTWHQTYMDNSGGLLNIRGGWTGTSMILQGSRRSPDGKERDHRIRWTPNEDGSVTQLYEGSEDGGASWQTLFEGRYVPVRRSGEQARESRAEACLFPPYRSFRTLDPEPRSTPHPPHAPPASHKHERFRPERPLPLRLGA